jgi:hypothetical protein
MTIFVTPLTSVGNTSFSSIVSDVYSLTNRPDLVAETALAVKAATIKAHQSDDFIKDLTEQSIQFTTADYYQSLDYKSVFPLWRKPRYIRIMDSSGTPSTVLTYIEPEKVVDNFGANRLDVFYVAGAEVQIRTLAQQQYFAVGYYSNPDVTQSGYKSWIADDHPFAITYEAAATVFKMIGQDEQVPTFRQMVADEYQLLKQHAITGIGM